MTQIKHRKKLRPLLWLLVVMVFFLLVACSSSSDNTASNTLVSSPTVENNPNESYPSPSIENNDISGYPSIELQGYPAPLVMKLDENKRFIINELTTTSEVINGSGLPNTPIKIINISYVGEVLGYTTVESDGTFSMNISVPLEEHHVIGVQLSEQGMEDEFQNGPDYTNIPMIGLVLASTIVK